MNRYVVGGVMPNRKAAYAALSRQDRVWMHPTGPRPAAQPARAPGRIGAGDLSEVVPPSEITVYERDCAAVTLYAADGTPMHTPMRVGFKP